MSHREDDLDSGALLLDPNNYRFQDLEGFVYAAKERYHEDSVQEKALQRLRREENLLALKSSILRNGYVPAERIVVRPYETVPGKWVVVEGNRRLAAVQWILEDFESGVAVPVSTLESIRTLPCVVIEEDAPDKVFRASLMGIRHVGGINQWGGYQRAKLVAEMKDDLRLDTAEVGERLGMTAHEVNRRYRAFKALQQMQLDEDFGGFAKPTMYPLFHEAVSLPVARTWLGWDDEACEFRNEETRTSLYELITPTLAEGNGGDHPPKISNRAQVRYLRDILPKPEALRVLLDPGRPVEDALTLAKRDELSRQWKADVASAIKALENIGVGELKALGGEDLALIQQLGEVVAERLSDRETLGS